MSHLSLAMRALLSTGVVQAIILVAGAVVGDAARAVSDTPSGSVIDGMALLESVYRPRKLHREVEYADCVAARWLTRSVRYERGERWFDAFTEAWETDLSAAFGSDFPRTFIAPVPDQLAEKLLPEVCERPKTAVACMTDQAPRPALPAQVLVANVFRSASDLGPYLAIQDIPDTPIEDEVVSAFCEARQAHHQFLAWGATVRGLSSLAIDLPEARRALLGRAATAIQRPDPLFGDNVDGTDALLKARSARRIRGFAARYSEALVAVNAALYELEGELAAIAGPSLELAPDASLVSVLWIRDDFCLVGHWNHAESAVVLSLGLPPPGSRLTRVQCEEVSESVVWLPTGLSVGGLARDAQSGLPKVVEGGRFVVSEIEKEAAGRIAAVLRFPGWATDWRASVEGNLHDESSALVLTARMALPSIYGQPIGSQLPIVTVRLSSSGVRVGGSDAVLENASRAITGELRRLLQKNVEALSLRATIGGVAIGLRSFAVEPGSDDALVARGVLDAPVVGEVGVRLRLGLDGSRVSAHIALTEPEVVAAKLAALLVAQIERAVPLKDAMSAVQGLVNAEERIDAVVVQLRRDIEAAVRLVRLVEAETFLFEFPLALDSGTSLSLRATLSRDGLALDHPDLAELKAWLGRRASAAAAELLTDTLCAHVPQTESESLHAGFPEGCPGRFRIAVRKDASKQFLVIDGIEARVSGTEPAFDYSSARLLKSITPERPEPTMTVEHAEAAEMLLDALGIPDDARTYVAIREFIFAEAGVAIVLEASGVPGIGTLPLGEIYMGHDGIRGGMAPIVETIERRLMAEVQSALEPQIKDLLTGLDVQVGAMTVKGRPLTDGSFVLAANVRYKLDTDVGDFDLPVTAEVRLLPDLSVLVSEPNLEEMQSALLAAALGELGTAFEVLGSDVTVDFLGATTRPLALNVLLRVNVPSFAELPIALRITPDDIEVTYPITLVYPGPILIEPVAITDVSISIASREVDRIALRAKLSPIAGETRSAVMIKAASELFFKPRLALTFSGTTVLFERVPIFESRGRINEREATYTAETVGEMSKVIAQRFEGSIRREALHANTSLRVLGADVANALIVIGTSGHFKATGRATIPLGSAAQATIESEEFPSRMRFTGRVGNLSIGGFDVSGISVSADEYGAGAEFTVLGVTLRAHTKTLSELDEEVLYDIIAALFKFRPPDIEAFLKNPEITLGAPMSSGGDSFGEQTGDGHDGASDGKSGEGPAGDGGTNANVAETGATNAAGGSYGHSMGTVVRTEPWTPKWQPFGTSCMVRVWNGRRGAVAPASVARAVPPNEFDGWTSSRFFGGGGGARRRGVGVGHHELDGVPYVVEAESTESTPVLSLWVARGDMLHAHRRYPAVPCNQSEPPGLKGDIEVMPAPRDCSWAVWSAAAGEAWQGGAVRLSRPALGSSSACMHRAGTDIVVGRGVAIPATAHFAQWLAQQPQVDRVSAYAHDVPAANQTALLADAILSWGTVPLDGTISALPTHFLSNDQGQRRFITCAANPGACAMAELASGGWPTLGADANWALAQPDPWTSAVGALIQATNCGVPARVVAMRAAVEPADVAAVYLPGGEEIAFVVRPRGVASDATHGSVSHATLTRSHLVEVAKRFPGCWRADPATDLDGWLLAIQDLLARQPTCPSAFHLVEQSATTRTAGEPLTCGAPQ